MHNKLKRFFLMKGIIYKSRTIIPASSSEAPARSKSNLNRAWKFKLSDHQTSDDGIIGFPPLPKNWDVLPKHLAEKVSRDFSWQ
jgi:hypothetical protein